MGLALAIRKPNALTDTFLMARRHTVWPVLNTAETGTWAWSGDAGKMFGGTYTNTSNTANDSISFDNLNLFSASVAINLLYTKASTGGVAKIYWGTKGEAGDLLGTIDMYAASTQKNQVAQFSLGTVTKARKTLHIVMETAGTGGGYTCQIQQAEVVQLTGTTTGTSLDDLPWVVDVPPVAYSANSGAVTLAQSTSTSWGSYVATAGAINNYIEWDVWLAEGTYDFSTVALDSGNRGIGTWSLNGSDFGTIDYYQSGGTYYNQENTISSVTVATTGVHKLRVTAATKNVSAGTYHLYFQWLQFRKTTTTGAITPTGATYGRESAELWPWFADTKVGFNTFTLSSSILHYGAYYQGANAQFNHMIWNDSFLAGSYSVVPIGTKFNSYGVAHLSNNGGSDIDTVSCYAASAEFNQKLAMSGSLSPGTIKLSMDTAGPGGGYQSAFTTSRLTRTGA